jgi:hypothetical protein
MRIIYGYAIVACLVSLGVSAFVAGASRRRGPSRGHGGVYAALLFAGLWLFGVLHGSIVSGIALGLGRTPVAWAAAGVHALLIMAVVLRVFVFKT